MLEPRRAARPDSHRKLSVHLAHDEAEITEGQRLRFRVFAEEMGARLPNPEEGIDRDRFDPWCELCTWRDPFSATDRDGGFVESTSDAKGC